MLELLTIKQWDEAPENNDAIHALEQGKVLYIPKLSFKFSSKEESLFTPELSNNKAKNISLNPRRDCVKGAGSQEPQLKGLLTRYAEHAHQLVTKIFPHYAPTLILGRTSYRPVAISGRISSYRKDDTRLHVDAFPATPMQGLRILRVFTNVNPHGEDRVWRLGEPFPEVAKTFLPRTKKPLWGSAKLLHLLRITKKYRSLYDHLMLQIHDAMKADLDYQAKVPQETVHFPPGSSWIVQTDQVSHAAMSGQYALEQTFYLPVSGMADPNLAPLKILEKMTGEALV